MERIAGERVPSCGKDTVLLKSPVCVRIDTYTAIFSFADIIFLFTQQFIYDEKVTWYVLVTYIKHTFMILCNRPLGSISVIESLWM